MFPSQVKSMEDDGVIVDRLKECFPGQNSFRWSQSRVKSTVHQMYQILCGNRRPRQATNSQLEQPTNTSSTIKLTDDDFK